MVDVEEELRGALAELSRALDRLRALRNIARAPSASRLLHDALEEATRRTLAARMLLERARAKVEGPRHAGPRHPAKE